nr:hypothetical protein HK105_004747 [Polyrhizophydium stewartii]
MLTMLRARAAARVPRCSTRSLWTSVTAVGPRAAREWESAVAALRQPPQQAGDSGSVAVLLVSPDFSHADIEALHEGVRRSVRADALVGAVVDAVGLAPMAGGGAAWSLSLWTPDAGERGSTVLAFSVPPVPVAARKNRSVGRWPDSFNRGGARRADTLGSAAFESVSQGPVRDTWTLLPRALADSPPSQMLLLTDNEPFELLQSSTRAFPAAAHLGVIAARTPFVTGRPFTLFHNDSVLSEGAVGVAFGGSATQPAPIGMSAPHLVPLAPPMHISRSRGNIILELDGRNASRELLAQIKLSDASVSAAGQQVFVRVHDAASGRTGLYPLSGGDLAKGTLAVDTLVDLVPGMQVEILRPTQHHHADLSAPATEVERGSGIVVGSIAERESLGAAASSTETTVHVHTDVAAWSELGFIRGDAATLGDFQVRKAIYKEEKKRLKKELEEQNLSMIAAGMSAELGYSNNENPFGDSSLNQKFVWIKKRESEAKRGVTAAQRFEEEQRKRRETEMELEKLKKQRAEREIEQQLREMEQLRLQREQDAQAVGEWIAKEDDFHLEQAKIRAQIRVKEGRAKPIDVLAINLSLGTDSQLASEFDALGLEMDINEPYLIFKNLSLKETEELHRDIQLYTSLEKDPSNKHFWEAMMVICEDELARLHIKSGDGDGRRGGVGGAGPAGPGGAAQAAAAAAATTGVKETVRKDIDRMLEHKTLDQLNILERQIDSKLSSGDHYDVDYWDTTLKAIQVWKAKARLRSMHEMMLQKRIERLRESLLDDEDESGGDASGQQGAEPRELVPLTFEAIKARALRDAAAQKEGEDVDADAEMYDPSMSPRLMEGIELEDEKLEVVDEETDQRQLAEARKAAEAKFVRTTKQMELKNLAVVAGVAEEDLMAEVMMREAAKDADPDEAEFKEEAALGATSYLWQDKYRPRKPRYFNRVHTGFEWNKYNQTHYDSDNPPPKVRLGRIVVQGYKFNIFYPDLIDKSKAPTYKIEKDPASDETAIIRFHAGPPYEDVAFRIVKREWEYSYKKGFRSSFDRGVLQLWFHFKRRYYRR